MSSVLLKFVIKNRDIIFFKTFNQFFCGWGCIFIYTCAYYTQDFIVIHTKPLSSGNNVYTDYIIISMLYCMSAVNCYEYIQLKNALHSITERFSRPTGMLTCMCRLHVPVHITFLV